MYVALNCCSPASHKLHLGHPSWRSESPSHLHGCALRDVPEVYLIRVPTQTGKSGKPGKMGRHFPVREKSGNFEQTRKFREKSGKITQNTGKTSGNFKKMLCYFLVIFKNELCIIC